MSVLIYRTGKGPDVNNVPHHIDNERNRPNPPGTHQHVRPRNDSARLWGSFKERPRQARVVLSVQINDEVELVGHWLSSDTVGVQPDQDRVSVANFKGGVDFRGAIYWRSASLAAWARTSSPSAPGLVAATSAAAWSISSGRLARGLPSICAIASATSARLGRISGCRR